MRKNRSRSPEQGTALTECALVLPLLTLLFLSVFDGVQLARDYFTMTEIAREVVLVASELRSLPVRVQVSHAPIVRSQLSACFTPDFTRYDPSPGNESHCAELVIRWRIHNLGTSYGETMNDVDYKILVLRDLTKKTVRIEIEKTLKGTTPAFRMKPVRTKAEGAYDL
jgi:hypothetical protein